MSKFRIIFISNKFEKTVNEFLEGKKLIRWEIMTGKNLLGQERLLIEYDD